MSGKRCFIFLFFLLICGLQRGFAGEDNLTLETALSEMGYKFQLGSGVRALEETLK